MNSELTPALQNALLGRINHMLHTYKVKDWQELGNLCVYVRATMGLRPTHPICLRGEAAACTLLGFILEQELADVLPLQRLKTKQDQNRINTFDEIVMDLNRLAPAFEDFGFGLLNESELLKVIGTTPKEWEWKVFDKPNQDYERPHSFEYLKALA
ncbi:hypothetical protein [Deinococcus marmoris]|uniref:hypothetical protein n=1 Tax=Deinococcus marmoris TaxID=249408 RepID=UPI00054D9852|nr:hypothetical protein [Deinococcus marmoris]